MMSRRAAWKWSAAWSRVLALVFIGLLPVAVVLLDFHPGALAGCGSYGYVCSETACFSVEVKTGASTWQKGSAWIYGDPGSTLNLYVRTTFSTNANQIEGWSFGLKHTAPTLIGIYGGNFILNEAASGPGVLTAQAGSAADFHSTRALTCGLTQGVAIDYHATHHTIGPATNLVTAYACYSMTFPTNYTVHQVTLSFTEDVGIPPVENLVERVGPSIIPCKETLVLNVQPHDTFQTQEFCDSLAQPAPCQPEGGGGGGGAGGPSVALMIDQGVEYLLTRMHASCASTPTVLDFWRHDEAEVGPPPTSGTAFFRDVATTAICAEAIVSAPGYESSPKRQTAVANATRFLLNNADSMSNPTPCQPTPQPSAACEVEAWVSFPLQFFIRLQELNRVPAGLETQVMDKSEDLIDAIPPLCGVERSSILAEVLLH